MLNLTSASVANLYTIPKSDWTAINQRVGEVLVTQKLQAFISQYLTGYPALLASSLLWQQSTFNGLISESAALANYAGAAITDFTNLNTKVKQVVGDVVPESLKVETITLLKNLALTTNQLARDSDLLANQVLAFLNNNRAVDAQIAANKDKWGSFWAPISQIINTLEDSAALVTGEWRAITDDLNDTVAAPINVTMPFLESLNIDAALVTWKNLLDEALAFPMMTKDQQQYWTNPTLK